jgi:hypothetical protein
MYQLRFPSVDPQRQRCALLCLQSSNLLVRVHLFEHQIFAPRMEVGDVVRSAKVHIFAFKADADS